MQEVRQEKKSMFENVPPKFTFLFGLMIGIAGFSLFGYISLLSRVQSGATTNTPATTTEDTTTVAQENDQVGEVAGETVPSTVTVAAISDADYVRGNENAPITIVEYSDLECPYCKSFHETMLQVMEKYPDDVRWVYRHFPLSFHPNAQKQAEGAECAGQFAGNEGFWNFVDEVFEQGTGADDLSNLAATLGMNTATFQTCLDSGTYADKIENSMAEASGSGVSGTPTSFILDAKGSVVQTIPGRCLFLRLIRSYQISFNA